jgi:hypothetical protein
MVKIQDGIIIFPDIIKDTLIIFYNGSISSDIEDTGINNRINLIMKLFTKRSRATIKWIPGIISFDTFEQEQKQYN